MNLTVQSVAEHTGSFAAGAGCELRDSLRAKFRRAGLARLAGRMLLGLALVGLMLRAQAGGVVSGCTEASLRAALSGGGQVSFSNDCTIALGQELVINQAATTIDAAGHNVVISGSNSVALLLAATNLVLKGLILANGQSTHSGAALYVQPGVTVIANRCLFVGNSVTASNGVAGTSASTNSTTASGADGTDGAPGAAALGGAIYNLGSLALDNCTLTNNAAQGGAGGSGGNGGTGTGTFVIPGVGGAGAAGGAGFGGAVYNLGDLTLVNCTFSGNRVTGGAGGAGGAGGSGSYTGLPGNGGAGGAAAGGAVFNAKNLTLLGSTFSADSAIGGNSANAGMQGNGTGLTGIRGADASGGALYNAWWAAVTNCTFYTNTVTAGAAGNGGNGGGTFGVPGDGGDGGDGLGGALANANTVTIVNCTFSSSAAFGGTNGAPGSGNFAGVNGNIGKAQGANLATVGGPLTLMNSILAAGLLGGNAFGSLTDGGHNLSSDTVTSFGPSSFQNIDPKLGLPAANGGPTLTMALLTNSPAIDRIPADQSPTTDQRGFPRPFHDLSDIGAFEFGAVGPATNVMLTITRATNRTTQLSGVGTPGQSYVVDASTNLVSWQSISTNVAPIQFTDPATNFPVRFYRLSR